MKPLPLFAGLVLGALLAAPLVYHQTNAAWEQDAISKELATFDNVAGAKVFRYRSTDFKDYEKGKAETEKRMQREAVSFGKAHYEGERDEWFVWDGTEQRWMRR